jgi:hypothetical protein
MSTAHKVTIHGGSYLDPQVRTLCQLIETHTGQECVFEAREDGTQFIEVDCLN